MSVTSTCVTCKVEHPADEFISERKKGRPRKMCSGCALRHNEKISKWRRANMERWEATRRKNMYGLSEDEYAALLERYPSCPVCGVEFGPGVRRCIDHCHATGRVRGLLCSHCNVGIGMLKESPFIFESALVYLANAKMAMAA